MTTTSTMTARTTKAVERFGEETCRRAYELNHRDGEGPSTVATYCGLRTTAQANAAINAGRELAGGKAPAPTTEQVATTIREAVEPMTADIAARFLAWMQHAAARFDEELAEARAELRAALETTDQTVEYPRWVTPKWMGNVWARGKTIDEAEKYAAEHLGDYSLANRKHGEGTNQGRWHREWLADARRYATTLRDRLPEEARREAENEVSRMVAKITGKVQKLGVVTTSSCRGRTTDSFTLDLTFAAGRRLVLWTNLIHNRTERGRPYLQWPTRIYDVNPDGSTGAMIPAAAIR